MSSLSVVCGDGVLASHKLVLATVSPFLSSVLAAIPTGDHVTLVMPDFGVDEVELFLQTIISEEASNNFHLSLALGITIQPLLTLEEDCRSYNEDEETIEKAQSISTLKDKELENDVSDDVNVNSIKEEMQLPIEANITRINTNEIRKMDENDEEHNSSNVEVPSRHADSAEVAREKFPDIEQQMDDLIKDFISNPSCEGERGINARIEYKISHLRAIKYLQRGTGEGIRKVAAKFGVNKSTLQRCLKTGQIRLVGSGSGRQFAGNQPIFSVDEEKRIAARARDLSNGGKRVTLQIIKEIITQEFSILRRNCPKKRAIKRFADRWNLLK